MKLLVGRRHFKYGRDCNGEVGSRKRAFQTYGVANEKEQYFFVIYISESCSRLR